MDAPSRRSTASWARLPIFLAELTGIHPTREGILVQVVLLSVYVLGRRLRVRLEAASPADAGGGAGMRLRVGIDVGGTFTKAVAVCPSTRELRAHAAVPTTHAHEHGVAQGVADALRSLLGSGRRELRSSSSRSRRLRP